MKKNKSKKLETYSLFRDEFLKKGPILEEGIDIYAIEHNNDLPDHIADPSLVDNRNWLYYGSLDYTPDALKGGKWILFASNKEVLEKWENIKDAYDAGLLGPLVKVSTLRFAQNYSPSHNTYYIIVYTENLYDKADIFRVMRNLCRLGYKRGYYKANSDSLVGKYAKNGDKNISIYSLECDT